MNRTDTDPIPFPWFAPSVPTRYVRPDRLRHLRASARAAFWPLVVGCGVILALSAEVYR